MGGKGITPLCFPVYGSALLIHRTRKSTLDDLSLSRWILFFEFEDVDRPLSGGGIAQVCEEGRIGTQEVCVRPIVDGR